MALQRFQHFIGGEFCNAAESFESVDPSTEQPWAVMPAASAEDVDRAVQAAHRALLAPEWADMTATARGKLLVRLGDLVAEHADRLAENDGRDANLPPDGRCHNPVRRRSAAGIETTGRLTALVDM